MRGAPTPFGALWTRDGINFAIFSRHATAVRLVLFLPGDHEPLAEFPLDPSWNRTGDVWHVFIRGLEREVEYGYRMTREPNREPQLYRFKADALLLDPYAKAVSGRSVWGAGYSPDLRALLADDRFEWGYDQPLRVPLADTIVYELHVRGFTADPSAMVANPGTFLGLTEKIPYLRELGVTAVELMPVQEFDEREMDRLGPDGKPLVNFWGYSTLGFFAPKASYASDPGGGGQIREFKEMVKRFHEAGIEVILDIVFNHTGEGDARGPTISFRGIDNSIYYIVDPLTGRYHNYSGCGNTMNCNHPVVRNFVLECLHYWVIEMHVDGFRFDLASILGRGRDGSVLANPPLLEQIAADPVLADTKLIAEAWDAAGVYQVGSFPAWSRWAEWNGKFRDDIRRFVRGDEGMVPALATRLLGSPDLYQNSQRHPYHSINFVTCHDGFTLADLVSYNEKHNEENGEENRDGSNDNCSWNCGAEGPTRDPAINQLRRRQMKNMATLLMLSGGVPMILAGDEFGRTQHGNNNPYCQDRKSWIDWGLRERNSDLFRFFRLLIRFRRQHPSLRRRTFTESVEAGGARITWHGVKLNQPDSTHGSRSLAMQVTDLAPNHESHIYLIANAYWEPLTFELPVLAGARWALFVDTFREAPGDIRDLEAGPLLFVEGPYTAGPRSTVVLASVPR